MLVFAAQLEPFLASKLVVATISTTVVFSIVLVSGSAIEYFFDPGVRSTEGVFGVVT